MVRRLSDLSGVRSPGFGPSSPAGRPIRIDFATPIAGTSSNTPSWQAIPNPRAAAQVSAPSLVQSKPLDGTEIVRRPQSVGATGIHAQLGG